MLFRHFTNSYFCDILYTEGKRNPGKNKIKKEVKIMERTVRILSDDDYLGEALANDSLSKTGAIHALGYDVNDPADCEQAYNNGFAAASVDDNGDCQIDIIGINFR